MSAQSKYDHYADEFVDDYDETALGCWNCDGEGYVNGCSWDWQCDTWDGDSCLCSRRCDVCNPVKLTAEQEAERDALRRRLADMLANPQEPK